MSGDMFLKPPPLLLLPVQTAARGPWGGPTYSYRGARIDKIVGKALGRWPPSALSQRNRRLSGECRLEARGIPPRGKALLN
jgi:hypothetical protein